MSQKGGYDLYTALSEQYNQVVNDVNELIKEKPDASEIPTKLSQLMNDANFKTESEIQSMIEKASSLKKEVVTSLPTTGKDDVIYLVQDPKGKDNNNYLEYLWLNGKYELIGSTQVDLSGYAKKSDMKTKLSEMTEDSTHRTVTDAEKTKWNNQFNELRGFAVKKVNKTNIPWVMDEKKEWTTTLGGYESLAKNDCELSAEISKKIDKTELVEFTDQEIEEAFK